MNTYFRYQEIKGDECYVCYERGISKGAKCVWSERMREGVTGFSTLGDIDRLVGACASGREMQLKCGCVLRNTAGLQIGSGNIRFVKSGKSFIYGSGVINGEGLKYRIEITEKGIAIIQYGNGLKGSLECYGTDCYADSMNTGCSIELSRGMDKRRVWFHVRFIGLSTARIDYWGNMDVPNSLTLDCNM